MGEISAVIDSAPDAVALLADEVSAAGDHAEGLLATALEVVRPGGVIAVSARSLVAGRLATGSPGGRTFSADELRRALGHLGVDVTLLCAPGAAAGLRGEPDGGYDEELDRLAGLLDAGPRVVAGGRAPASMADRSREFFATLPYKVVAAAVICRNGAGDILVVHDSFKRYWTIPGGVVDADEDPRKAAERESWEEAGIRVDAGVVLGVFSASWPDRVVLVYDAVPVEGGAAAPKQHPVHAHEIDAVAWWPVEQALRDLAPHIAEQVRHCLECPGHTLRQRRA